MAGRLMFNCFKTVPDLLANGVEFTPWKSYQLNSFGRRVL